MNLFEILAFIGIVLFGLIQVVMTVVAVHWFPKVKAWKDSLRTSRSMLAKSALIIFF